MSLDVSSPVQYYYERNKPAALSTKRCMFTVYNKSLWHRNGIVAMASYTTYVIQYAIFNIDIAIIWYRFSIRELLFTLAMQYSINSTYVRSHMIVA